MPASQEMPRRDEKDENVTVSIRFPKNLHKDAETEANADDRTLNSLVVKAVRVYVEGEQAKRKAGR